MSRNVPISVAVITLNEEKNIARCLDSVVDVADEIVVVDSLSTDRTREIAAERGARVIEQPFLGHIQQKNFAMEQAKHRHVLSLDADECLSPELARQVAEAKQDFQADGYTVNRYNNYYGYWIKGAALYPDRKLRMWDRERGRWDGMNPHDKVHMQPGTDVRQLKGDLLHYAYDSLTSHMDQANKFSSIAARAYHEKGRRGSVAAMALHPTFRFLWDYFPRRGFMDGFPGFMVCAINAYMTFLKYAKLRDLQQRELKERQAGSEPAG